jgi:hypothetical protein
MAKRDSRRPLPKPPQRRREPVALKRFGPTGAPVKIPRRTFDIAKREGLRLEEDSGRVEAGGRWGEIRPDAGKSRAAPKPRLSAQQQWLEQLRASRVDAPNRGRRTPPPRPMPRAQGGRPERMPQARPWRPGDERRRYTSVA